MHSQLNLERAKDKGIQEEILSGERRQENETGRSSRIYSFVSVKIVLEFWLVNAHRAP